MEEKEADALEVAAQENEEREAKKAAAKIIALIFLGIFLILLSYFDNL